MPIFGLQRIKQDGKGGLLLLLKNSSPFRAVCSLCLELSNPFGAVCVHLLLNTQVPFEQFAPYLKYVSPFRAVCSLPAGGLLRFLIFSSPFQNVCSCFSMTKVLFEQLALVSQVFIPVGRIAHISPTLEALLNGLLLFLNTLDPFEQFVPASQRFYFLSSGLVPFARLALVANYSSPFPAVCSSFQET